MVRGLKFRNYIVEVVYYVANTKATISCVVTMQLICAFAFAYAKEGFLVTRFILTSSPKGNDAHLRAIIQSEKKMETLIFQTLKGN